MDITLHGLRDLGLMLSFGGLPFFLIVVHWVADFVLQTHWMATNKSKSWKALSAHVAVYTATFWSLLMALFLGLSGFVRDEYVVQITVFALVNGAIHFVVDAITSRMTSHLWAKGDVHNFFVVVGFDQVIHYFTLLVTFYMFLLSVCGRFGIEPL